MDAITLPASAAGYAGCHARNAVLTEPDHHVTTYCRGSAVADLAQLWRRCRPGRQHASRPPLGDRASNGPGWTVGRTFTGMAAER